MRPDRKGASQRKVTPVKTDREHARALDAQDALARFRNEFVIDDPNLIYLDGNSLGRLPRRSAARVREVVERGWGSRLVRAWGEGWLDAPRRVGSKIAGLIGAQPDEVIVADSTTVDLFKLVGAAIASQPDRHKLVTDDLNFPTDLYVMQGAAKLAGACRVEMVHSKDGMTMSSAALAAAIDHDTALVELTHTAFKSGFVYDMRSITDDAHRSGALILWDLCHSVGAMPLALDDDGVDLAVGCTYKYLNGGPGAPAFLFIRRDLQDRLSNPIWGWFGQKEQFEMGPHYDPAPGMTRWMAGTPSIISLAAVEPAVDMVIEAGIDALREKSIALTEYAIALWEAWLEPLGLQLNSPRDPAQRGSHVSLGHPDGLRIDRALIEEMNVVPDFRYPDNIRLGVAPLYTSFAEVYEGMARLRRVMDERLYEKYPTARPQVT